MAKKVTNAPTTQYTREFVKCFEKLRYRYDAFNVFSDFLAMTAISISNAVNPNDEHEQENLRIVEKYNEEERELFPKMFACIVNEMQPAKDTTPRYYDVLGELFGGLELHDAWKGQFFTPQFVSDVIGEIQTTNLDSIIEEYGYASALEPCIGGGSMVIGFVNAMYKRGYNPCKQLLVTGYDLDPRCVHMSYIQLSLMGIPAMIQQRNSLTDETYGDYWYTPIFIIDDWAGRLSLERAVDAVRKFFSETGIPAESVNPTKTPEPVKPVEIPAPKKPVQLTLF